MPQSSRSRRLRGIVRMVAWTEVENYQKNIYI
jgi:hypothetical protein